MRQLRIRGFVIGALLLAVLAGVTGSVDAMQIT
jgi:hypothetical protein